MTELFEKVEEASVVYFRIDRCPQPIFIEFKKFCESESKSLGLDRINYVVGLKKLLDIKNKDEANSATAPEKEEEVVHAPIGFGRKQ